MASSAPQIVKFIERVERFVREPERCRITGISKAAWYRLELDGLAPRRIRIHTRTVGWKLSELERWVSLTARGETWTPAVEE